MSVTEYDSLTFLETDCKEGTLHIVISTDYRIIRMTSNFKFKSDI